MSDLETDLYNEMQEELYQNFCAVLDHEGYEVGKNLLDSMSKFNRDMDHKTFDRCKDYLNDYVIIGEDVVLEDEDADAYAKEREAQRAESRNAPSEGFETH